MGDFGYSDDKFKVRKDPYRGYRDDHTHELVGNLYHWIQSPEGYWHRVKAGKVVWEIVPAVDQYGNFCAAYRRVREEDVDSVDRSNVVVHREFKKKIDDNVDESEGSWSEWNEDIETEIRNKQIEKEKKKSYFHRKKKKPKVEWIWCRTMKTGKRIVEKKTRNRKKYKRTEEDKANKSRAYWANQEKKKREREQE